MKQNLAAAVLLLVPLLASAQEKLLRAGPMVGYSEMREVALWVQTTGPAKVRFAYWDREKPAQKYQTAELSTSPEGGFTATAVADQVQPGKKYAYELYLNNKKVDRPYPLAFQSQPLWQWRADPPAFKFATGSCFYVNETEYDRPGKPYGGGYEIATAILGQQPDFMLWLGDNTYLREPDWNTWTGIVHRYGHTRALPELQPLLGSVHHYATWDDHDYGPDNSDRSFWNKAQTLKAFKLFWPNPNYVLGDHAGVTGTFAWHDVQFFLLDDRWYKTPNHNTTALAGETADLSGPRPLLGDAQLQWLVDALSYSKAPFKFVVIGSQVLNPVEQEDSYAFYPQERDKLLAAIAAAKIPGVIFLDGDRHFTSLTKLERPGTYPLYDITISPLTAGTYSPKENNTLLVPGTLVTDRNFALMEVSGPRTDRVLTIRVLDAAGKERWTRQIKASELK
jgi:alkaline phosphatase D